MCQFLKLLYAQTSKLKLLKNYSLFFVRRAYTCDYSKKKSLIDHNNEIDDLPWLAVPSLLFKFWWSGNSLKRQLIEVATH